MKENFIPSIVNFNTDDITDDIRKVFARDYQSNPEYTYDRIYRANVASRPMVKWAIAQLEYAEMLNRVDPLRQELKALEEASVIKKNKDSRMHEQITTLTTMDKLHRALTGHCFDINHCATIRVGEAGPQPCTGDQMNAGDQMNGRTTAATLGARAGTS